MTAVRISSNIDLAVDKLSLPLEFTVVMPVDNRNRSNLSQPQSLKPSPLDLPKQADRCVHVEALSVEVKEGEEPSYIYRRCYNNAFNGWLCGHHQARLLEDYQDQTVREMEKARLDRNDERNLIGLRLKMGDEVMMATEVAIDYMKYTRWGWWKEDSPAPVYVKPVEEDEAE